LGVIAVIFEVVDFSDVSINYNGFLMFMLCYHFSQVGAPFFPMRRYPFGDGGINIFIFYLSIPSCVEDKIGRDCCLHSSHGVRKNEVSFIAVEDISACVTKVFSQSFCHLRGE
jgi:hypothetical protein